MVGLRDSKQREFSLNPRVKFIPLRNIIFGSKYDFLSTITIRCTSVVASSRPEASPLPPKNWLQKTIKTCPVFAYKQCAKNSKNLLVVYACGWAVMFAILARDNNELEGFKRTAPMTCITLYCSKNASTDDTFAVFFLEAQQDRFERVEWQEPQKESKRNRHGYDLQILFLRRGTCVFFFFLLLTTTIMIIVVLKMFLRNAVERRPLVATVETQNRFHVLVTNSRRS